jgi:pimeloyl-ACP methyl ester carboxylesterase
VVTYDRRGLSRSTLDDPDEHPDSQTHGDDAHRLLAHLTTEPSLVLGTSLGARAGGARPAGGEAMRRIAVDHADLEPGVELPGDHAGFATRPRAFAAGLAGVLGD